jgi:hypothetical protein
MSASSDYQQLRSHLATLRLAAAAEALPGLLDQARAEKWSTTVLLERLLSVEVEATVARRHARMVRNPTSPKRETSAAGRPAAGNRSLQVCRCAPFSLVPRRLPVKGN